MKINLLNIPEKTKQSLKRKVAITTTIVYVLISAFPYGPLALTATSNASSGYTMYGTQDSGGSDSSFFAFNSASESLVDLGSEYDEYDFEGSDIHPSTGVWYAIAGGNGNHDGEVYKVDKTTGVLTYAGIVPGAVGSNEIQAASFHPDGSLWAAMEDDGLVKITFNGSGDVSSVTSVWEPQSGGDDKWEGLAWNLGGTELYASRGSKLILWDPSASEDKTSDVCTLEHGNTEALEFNPNGVLLAAHHNVTGVYSVNYQNGSCDETLFHNVNRDDIETITFDGSTPPPNQCDGNHAPVAVMNPTNIVGAPGDTIVFDALGSSDEDGDDLSYLWAINELGVEETGETFEYTFTELGEYIVTLTVGDECATDSVWTVVDIVDSTSCELTLTKFDDVESVYAGDSITYTIHLENTGDAKCTGGGVELVETYDPLTSFTSSTPSPDDADNYWNFGTIQPDDSHTVQVEVAVSQGAHGGDIIHNQVCAWAAEFGPKDDENNWICATEDTPVIDPPNQCEDNHLPEPVISPENPSIEVGESVSFTAAGSSDSDGDSLEYLWAINELGVEETGETFSYTFTEVGEYIVTLKAADQCGYEVVWTTVTVTEEPVGGPEQICYLVADAGGSHTNGGNDIVTKVNLLDLDPATNESNLGTGTGTYKAESIAIHPQTETIYTVDSNQVGTVDAITGEFTALPQTLSSGVGELGSKSFNDIDGLIFDPFTNILFASVRSSGADLLIQIDPSTGSHVSGAFSGNDYVPIDPVNPQVTDIDDIAIDPTDGTMFAVANENGGGDRLITVNKLTGDTSDVAEIGVDSIEGLTFDEFGQLIGVHGDSKRKIYDIDKTTAAISNTRVIDNASDYEGIACFIAEQTNQCVGNSTPVPVISPENPMIFVGDTVNFDSDDSTDAEDDSLEFLWAINQLSVEHIGDTFSYTFTEVGEYIVTLKAADQCGYEVVWTTVTVKDVPDQCVENGSPVPVIQPQDPVIIIGDSVDFTAASSTDPDGDILNFTWFDTYNEVLGTSTDITITPTSTGIHTITLEAADQCTAENISTTITVTDIPNQCEDNSHPTPVINPIDPFIALGDSISFSAASSTDAEGDSLTFGWMISGSNEITPGETFDVTPTTTGEFIITLIAGDQCGANEITTVLTVTDEPDQCTGNHAPVAVAGDDINVKVGESFTLDATGSTDEDGDVLSFLWTIPSQNATFTTATATTSIADEGSFEAFLIVADACTEDSDSLIINVTKTSTPPPPPPPSCTNCGFISNPPTPPPPPTPPVSPPPVVPPTPPTVLGTTTTGFIPPVVSPRAGSGIPMVDIAAGLASGAIAGFGMFLTRRRKENSVTFVGTRVSL